MLAAALVLRLLTLHASLWMDEAGSLERASAGSWWTVMSGDIHPPLYFLLLRAGLHLTHSFAALRLMSLAFGGAALAAFLWHFRASPAAAFATVALLGTLPELVRHDRELRPYALLLLFLAASTLVALARAAQGGSARLSVLLAALLAGAAATHALTAFFMAALAPFLVACAPGRGIAARLRSLLPMAPAAAVLAWARISLLAPQDVPGGWWIPRATAARAAAAISDVGGVPDLRQLCIAASRHVPGGSVATAAVLAASAAGLLAIATRAAARPGAARWLLAAAAAYVCLVVGYSFVDISILIARSFIPVPLFGAAAVGCALASEKDARIRRAACACAAVMAAALGAADVRAAVPGKGTLRDLAQFVSAGHRDGDLLLLFRSTETALKPYWPGVADAGIVPVGEDRPAAAVLASIRPRLGRAARVVIVYREDYYSAAYAGDLRRILAGLSVSGFPMHEAWQGVDMRVLEGARGPGAARP
jgi:hypothetical protein